MLTIYIGQKNIAYDTLKQKLIKQYDGQVQYIDTAFADVAHISETALTMSMFDPVGLYIVSGIDIEILSEVLIPCASSEHHFLVVMDSITAPNKKKLEKLADNIPASRVIWAIQEKAKAQAPRVNPFSITNSLPTADRKKLWVSLVELRGAGVEPENTFGILFWKYKDMLTKGNAGSDQTLARMGQLVHTYHRARREGIDMSDALEMYILNLK